MPQTIELFDEFAERQACHHVTARNVPLGRGQRGELVVFANGASSTGTVHAEPAPDGSPVLLRHRRLYLETHLAEEVRAFESAKRQLQTQAQNAARSPEAVPLPKPRAIAKLKRGADKIKAIREELAGVMAELDKTGDVEREARRAREMARSQDKEAQARTLQAEKVAEQIRRITHDGAPDTATDEDDTDGGSRVETHREARSEMMDLIRLAMRRPDPRQDGPQTATGGIL